MSALHGMMEFMGWSPDLVARAKAPTYPCLIDTNHVIAQLYGITNVPMGVWIDEEGHIVRPAEAAGTSDSFRRMNPATFTVPPEDAEMGRQVRRRYGDAVRDWAQHGAKSRFVLAPDEVRRRLRGPSASDSLAAAWVKLGAHLHRAGDFEGAKRAFVEAMRLEPDSWNYKRNGWMLEPGMVGQLNGTPEFFAAVQALGDKPYYPPTDI